MKKYGMISKIKLTQQTKIILNMKLKIHQDQLALDFHIMFTKNMEIEN